jgi:hypothetical protein
MTDVDHRVFWNWHNYIETGVGKFPVLRQNVPQVKFFRFIGEMFELVALEVDGLVVQARLYVARQRFRPHMWTSNFHILFIIYY